MPTTYNPTATDALVLGYTLPSGGDLRNASSVNVPFQGEADDISRLANGRQVSASYTAWFDQWEYFVDAAAGANAVQWQRYQDGSGHWRNENNENNYGHDENQIDVRIRLPDGCSLTQLDCYLEGPTHTMLFTKPLIELTRFDPSAGGSPTVLASVPDPSTGFITYAAHHTITIATADLPGGVPVVIDATKTYRVVFVPESAPNNLDGTLLFAVKATFTTSKMDRRAA